MKNRFMLNYNRIFICVLLICVASCSPSQSQKLVQLPGKPISNSLDSSQAQVVYKYVKNFPNGTEIAIAFLNGDSTKYVGIRRRNDSLIYVENREAVFEIGSITKTFTAAMLAELVYNNKVDLNEPIKNILPVQLHQSSLNGKEVTLLHLANHTSGFPKEPDNVFFDWSIPGSPYKFYDTAKLYDYLSKRITLLSTPGTKREYSNLGGGLLGHLLTLITGTSYENLLGKLICKPLDMRNTFVSLNNIGANQLIPGRDPNGNVVQNWELNVLVGGGGIKSSAEDMAKYLRAQMMDTTFYLMTQQPTFKYTGNNFAGLGWTWFAIDNFKFVSATGGTGGYSCCVIFERGTKKAIVLLTNVSAFLASKDDPISNMSIELHKSL
ncbi:MAG: serine hydrolase domain-containing protein [Bacteroidota bacterium]